MSILKKKFTKGGGKKDAKLIGLYIPKGLASYLTLYCASKGITKTFILKDFIVDWIKAQRKKESESKLCEDIAIKAFTLWKKKRKGKKNLSYYSTFKKKLEKELIKNNLEMYVDQVFKYLDDEKKKNQSGGGLLETD